MKDPGITDDLELVAKRTDGEGGKRPPASTSYHTSVPFLAQRQRRAGWGGGRRPGARQKLPDALSLSNLGHGSAQHKTDSSDRFRNKRLNAGGLEKTKYLPLTRAGSRFSG